jgi:hypothetical protein
LPPLSTRTEEEDRMATIKGNRSKRKASRRSQPKRAQVKRKRVLSIKRKRRSKRGPR